MAGPPAKRVVELIDLTLDDDDDDDAGPIPPTRTNGGVNPHNSNAFSAHNAQAHSPASGYLKDEPPAKRIKFTNTSHAKSAQSTVRPYAQAGAKQAAAEDPRLVEAIVREKLEAELLRQFESRIKQQITQNGFIDDSVHQEIIDVIKALLSRLVALPECRHLPPPPTASAPAAPLVPARSWVNNNGSPLKSADSPAPTASPSRPIASTNGQAGPQSASSEGSQAPPARSPAYTNGLPAFALPRQTPNLSTAQSMNTTIEPRGGLNFSGDVQKPQTRSITPRAIKTQSAAGTSPSASSSVYQAPIQQTAAQQTPVSQSPAVHPIPSPRRPISRDIVSDLEPASTPRQPRQRRDGPITPSSGKKARTNVNAPTTPQNFHARAKTAQWKADGLSKVETKSSSYFALGRRPYVGTKAKEAILRGNGRLSRMKPTLLQKSEVFHVDFTSGEVHKVLSATRKALDKADKPSDNPYRDLSKLLKRLKTPKTGLPSLARTVSRDIPGREADDVHAFLEDFMDRRGFSKRQQVLSVEKDPFDKRGEDLRESRLTSLLLAREVAGNRFGGMRRLENFTNEFHKMLEDGLQIRSEFTNCAGDISTVCWISKQAYIAGTTVHMDSHNQQYNKPGNLVLGSISRGNASLKAYADHRIVRPVIHKGENSTSAMRETQDPWLYTSVVFSDYDPLYDRAYTSSFDRTVKAWKADPSGGSMRCIGTWEHQGPVNFVQASSYEHSNFGLVATAADVPTSAVRVYTVDNNDDHLSTSSFAPFSCSKINANHLDTDKWTYFPSTMKWGIEQSVKHYLLVGYSPRSTTGDDGDIPPEMLNTGELCLWDAINVRSVHIRGANSQNVFEVLWHPTQAVFIAATSSKGVDFKDNRFRTQVRIFGRSNEFIGDFSELKALDCMAADINELTIMPNSVFSNYVTAGCTDGKTYVWDTALSDKPIHVLAHGPPLEGIRINDAEDDTGVKFTAWGSSLDHFYTGSSDGVVKVWNVRSEKKAKGKVILEASAQISFGAFSPDHSKLVIGDASGRVFVLSVDEDDGKPPTFIRLPGALTGTKRRMPTEVEHHEAPPPPPGTVNMSGVSAAGAFLAARQLRHTGDPTIGVVKDVNYASTGLFRKEFHFDHDPSQELFAQYTVRQLEDTKIYSDALPIKTKALRRVTYTPHDADDDIDMEDGRRALVKRHEENCKLDLMFENLSLEIRDLLSTDGVGQRELWEGVEYDGILEDDEAEVARAKIEVSKEAQEDYLFVGSEGM